MMLSFSEIRSMPKVVLHDHLDGGLRATTIVELANQQHIDLPISEPEKLAEWFYNESVAKDLFRCLNAFSVSCSVMQTPESLRRVAYEMMADFANDNVIYVESRFCPFLHLQQGLSYSEVMDSIILGMEQGKRDFGIEYGILICGIRNFTDEINFELAKLCVEFYGEKVVGFDFAGADIGFPLSRQKNTLDLLHKHNIPLTVHAGEAGDIFSIIEALDNKALRIGHACQILNHKDERLVNEVIKRMINEGIHVEINLSSNLGTGVVSELDQHPVMHLFNNGVSLALNPDDRLMFNNSTTNEYWLLAEKYGINEDDIVKMNISALKASFASQEIKDCLIEKYFSHG
ncbi:adenosine deaminase [Aquella oligotrophica]|nr:adenosine deaminase [Aquella oligotrophica]